MKRSTSRIITTHTGSLPRPEGLVEMLGAVSRGEPVDQATLDAAADEATAGVVAAQLAAGVDVINNGEQSRIRSHLHVQQLLVWGQPFPVANFTTRATRCLGNATYPRGCNTGGRMYIYEGIRRASGVPA